MKEVGLMQFTEERQTAKFYCDTCGAYLGENIADEDGCIEEIGEVSTSFYVHGWWYKQGNFCATCKDIFFCRLEDSLEKLGYVKGVRK